MTDSLPLLSLLIVTLPLGATLIWLLPGQHNARWVALITALVDLGLSLMVLAKFDPAATGFQLIERAHWIPTLNVQYLMGVDGLSVLFLPLTVILFIGVILASWNSSRIMPRLYFSLLLLLESTTLGIFCALDTMLFFFFWELTLIPLYFLVAFWGIGANRRYAAVKYTLFMLVGGVPLLFGFLLLAFNHADIVKAAIPAGLTFDYMVLTQTPLAGTKQTVIFLLLLAGFAFKTPVFPFHTWLPVTASEGPPSVVALITGLKLGAYGLIRFVIPLAPEAAQSFHWLLAGLGCIAVLYGAVAAMAQTNLRHMLAFSSISHVGLVVMGIASFSLQGIQGAVFQLLNFTLIAGGLFLLTGMLQHRTGSTDIASLGGVAKNAPMLATFFLLFGLASLGVPGTSGFPAEFLIVVSVLNTHTGAGLAALAAMILAASYFLTLYRGVFFGPVRNAVVGSMLDLRRRELFIATIFGIVILIAGFYPAAVLNVTQNASKAWMAHIGPVAK
ncbi:MAG: NADH-quinone oxidoreductase subunit M [Gammaproteobacteria bacterium]|nr:NADH-quinone oxidoreductase subunit M [Gammaproteobacteria bacterium]